MDCRKDCGACCIAPSISSPIPGMPDGKTAGVKCIHLREDYSCGIYAQRPKVCIDFLAEKLVCGSSRQEALTILSRLEKESGLRL
ncbi:MAG: YkgJ family cysteine cluster protein [Bacteroidales bacterium]|nr:YkgJ family cysteine cluster protein [Bacteroidales bacterium]